LIIDPRDTHPLEADEDPRSGLLPGDEGAPRSGCSFAMIVYGDRGTLLVHQPRAVREGQKVATGRVHLVTGDRSELVDPPALAADERDGPTYFLSRVAAGRPVDGLCAPEVGRDAQEVIAAALRSAATGREVTLPPTREKTAE